MTNRSLALPVAAAALCVLSLGACAMRGTNDRDAGRDTYLGGRYVAERAYPQRVHYHEASDNDNVYYYDERRPDVIVERRMYRENDGRTYYVEREGGSDRRWYFDDDAARSRGPGRGRGRHYDHPDGRTGDYDDDRRDHR